MNRHAHRAPAAGTLPGALRSTALAAALVAVLGLVLAAAGCQETQRRKSADESLARAIAVVNNERIAFESFQNDYQLFLTRWDRFVQNDPAKKQEIKELLLQRQITALLIDQEARRKGIEVDDAALNTALLALLVSPETDPAAAESVLAQEGLTEWGRNIRRRLIHERVVQQEVLDKIRLTPAELRSYYDKHRERFFRPERVKVRHIAVGSRSLYNRVMRLLRRNRDFVKLVRQYSITPDRYNDGELGYVPRGVLPKEFDEAIFAMKRVGSVTPRSSPVKTQIGYHIFRLEGRQPEGQLSFRRALPEIRAELLRDKQAEAYQRWLEHLRQKATIHIDDDLLHTD